MVKRLLVIPDFHLKFHLKIELKFWGDDVLLANCGKTATEVPSAFLAARSSNKHRIGTIHIRKINFGVQAKKQGVLLASSKSSICWPLAWNRLTGERFSSGRRKFALLWLPTRAGVLRIAVELCDLPMPEGPAPSIGDDRDCAEPYRELMTAELG